MRCSYYKQVSGLTRQREWESKEAACKQSVENEVQDSINTSLHG